MSTALPTGPTPQAQAADHFHQIELLFPGMPEPQKGAVSYAVQVAHNPALDARFCETSGKVIHIHAKLAAKCDTAVTVRGDSPLKWDADYHADVAAGATPDFFEREFTFHVPKEQMNKIFSFKLAIPGTAMKWNTGENFVVDLSKFGHIVDVKITGVKFK